MFDGVLNAHRHNYCRKGLSLSVSVSVFVCFCLSLSLSLSVSVSVSLSVPLSKYYTSLIISFQELIEEVEPYIKNKDTDEKSNNC